MIKEMKGNLLSVKSGHIMHGCNAFGIMGSGVAKCVKDAYPECYDLYVEFCEGFTQSSHTIRKNLILGRVDSFSTTTEMERLYIHNAITQYDYGTDNRKLDYEALCKALENINHIILNISNVDKVLNFPMIGAGLAGGDWNIIKVMIDEVIDDSIEKVLWIYEG